MLPEAWPAVELFCLVASQWRVGPGGVPVGLDYGAVDAACRLADVRPTPEAFAGLRVMERAAVAAMAERAASRQPPRRRRT